MLRANCTGRKSESSWPIDRAVADALAIAGGAKAQTEGKYKIARSTKSSDAERIAMVRWLERRTSIMKMKENERGERAGRIGTADGRTDTAG